LFDKRVGVGLYTIHHNFSKKKNKHQSILIFSLFISYYSLFIIIQIKKSLQNIIFSLLLTTFLFFIFPYQTFFFFFFFFSHQSISITVFKPTSLPNTSCVNANQRRGKSSISSLCLFFFLFSPFVLYSCLKLGSQIHHASTLNATKSSPILTPPVATLLQCACTSSASMARVVCRRCPFVLVLTAYFGSPASSLVDLYSGIPLSLMETSRFSCKFRCSVLCAFIAGYLSCWRWLWSNYY
jgi:hypothetical protein